MDVTAFRLATEQIGLHLTPTQIEAFSVFEDRLYEANEVMNLTRVPRKECWLRHFTDSLLFHDLLPNGATVLDIGTGPGFPAWPLACARPDLMLTALDSTDKMLLFLAQNLLPNLQTAQMRAEEWHERERFDVVTGRALAPLSIQLELSAAPCKIGGAVIPMRTVSDLAAIECLKTVELGLELERIEQWVLPELGAVRLFPIYRKSDKTDRKYPRKWAEIRKQPL